MPPQPPVERRVPTRALVLSIVALLVPVAGALLVPDQLGDYGALLWLLALIPAFLLAYYRGWRGVATALAAGMATLAFTQAVATIMGREVPDLLLGIVVAYLGISLGIGWLAEVLHKDRDEVEDLAFTDGLTNLPNRRHARVFLENEFAAAERGRLLSVALFDFDHFREYNERWGEQMGDRALVALGEILSRTTRRMNLSARFGGEEFVSVLAGTGPEGAMIYTERVREAFKALRLPKGTLTVSAGVATYHPSMRSPDELLAAADHALYQAKHEGRDQAQLFGRSLLDETLQSEPLTLEQLEAGAEDAGVYPRPDEQIGRSRPPLTLLPHQITEFGAGRRVLVVEDEDQVRTLIARYLTREAFEVEQVRDVQGALNALKTEYDVAVTDIRLPGASGIELISTIKSRWPTTQVVVITGLWQGKVVAEALAAGADRYLFKPFGIPELRAHLVDALSRRDRILAGQAEREAHSPERRERLERSREKAMDGVRSLTGAVETRTPHLEGHGEAVADCVRILAGSVADLEVSLDSLLLGAHVHDLGMIGISPGILDSDGSLTPDEIKEMRRHPLIGRRILVPFVADPPILEAVAWHHERWDGTGYPDGLAGEGIPFPARIVGLASALVAMTSSRPWRDPLPWEEVVEEVRSQSGGQFDPDLVERLEEVLQDVEALLREGVGP